MPLPPRSLIPIDLRYYAHRDAAFRPYWGKFLLPFGLIADHTEQRQGWLDTVDAWTRSRFGQLVQQRFRHEQDRETLASLLARVGVFSERFFHVAVRERVTRSYLKDEINPVEFVALLSEASQRPCRAHDRYSAIWRITDHVYDRTLLELTADAQVAQLAAECFERQEAFRPCGLCGAKFRPVNLPDWAYFGSNAQEACCLQCELLQRPNKRDLTRLIAAFVEQCGFIPRADASPIEYSFTSRLTPSQWLPATAAYARMGGPGHVKAKFGSWFEGLAHSGVLPEGALRTARGYRCLASDGHICHSLDEQRIDDWLSAHNVPHKREPRYPVHPTLNPHGLRRADWLVGEVFVEHFGLAGQKDYDRKMIAKFALAETLGIRLLPLYPANLSDLDRWLGALLESGT